MWLARDPEDWKESSDSPVSKRGRRIQGTTAAQPHHDPWEGGGAGNPGNFPDIVQDKKVTASSQHGLMKRNPCLTNLVAFHNEVTDLVYVCTTGKKDWQVITQSNDQIKTRFLLYVIDSRNVYLT